MTGVGANDYVWRIAPVARQRRAQNATTREGHCLAVHIGHEAVLADMAQPYEGFCD